MGDVPGADDVVLHAEDVLRGYRPDIQDTADSRWRSLSQLTARSTVQRPRENRPRSMPTERRGSRRATSKTRLRPLPTLRKEATCTSARQSCAGRGGASSRRDRDGQSSPKPEPPPATTQSGHPERPRCPRRRRLVADPPVELDPNFPLAPSIAPVAGSLPALRFAHEYCTCECASSTLLRQRSVDMRDPDDSVATAPVPYRRFDPVLPPTLVPRAAFREGDSIERMVIRSDRGVSASEYAASHPAHDAAPPLRAVDDRHLLPPSAAELTVEMSGLLDDAFAPGERPGRGVRAAAREAHTVRDHVAADPTDLNRVVRTPQPGAVMRWRGATRSKRLPGHRPGSRGRGNTSSSSPTTRSWSTCLIRPRAARPCVPSPPNPASETGSSWSGTGRQGASGTSRSACPAHRGARPGHPPQRRPGRRACGLPVAAGRKRHDPVQLAARPRAGASRVGGVGLGRQRRRAGSRD